MDSTKIRLSAEEAALVHRADWILTKNGVIGKAKLLLEEVLTDQQQLLSTLSISLPEEVAATSPKISRGENYKGLPYLVLDHPRYFQPENVFAIRTLFWWGNFFSCTLQVAGRYRQQLEEKLWNEAALLGEEGFFISCSNDPWEHHFDDDNYRPLASIDRAEYKQPVREAAFIKLSKPVPLEEWNEAGARLLDIFKRYLALMGQLPNR